MSTYEVSAAPSTTEVSRRRGAALGALGARLWRHPLGKLAAFAQATPLLVALAAATVPIDKVCPDFIQFWTAATLLSSGQDPYDATLQCVVQRKLGWRRETDGLGLYDFLPYYYPPWLGLACIPLLPLGFPLARITWFVLGGEFLLIAGFLLRNAVAGIPRIVPIVTVLAFGPSAIAAILGQVSPLLLLLVAAAWRLLETRRDFAAGCILALATIKPQLTGILLLGLLCRSIVEGRWRVVWGFVVSLAALCLACTLASPSWPLAMIWAPRVTPLPTFYSRTTGSTWLVVLKALGLGGWPAAGAYLLAVAPFVVAVGLIATDKRRRWDDLIGVCLIATFFVAPYGRPYDFPVLLVPALIMVGTRLPQLPAAAFLATLVAAPYAQSLAMTLRQAHIEPAMRVYSEPITFWIPLLIALAWWGSMTWAARSSVKESIQRGEQVDSRANAG